MGIVSPNIIYFLYSSISFVPLDKVGLYFGGIRMWKVHSKQLKSSLHRVYNSFSKPAGGQNHA